MATLDHVVNMRPVSSSSNPKDIRNLANRLESSGSGNGSGAKQSVISFPVRPASAETFNAPVDEQDNQEDAKKEQEFESPLKPDAAPLVQPFTTREADVTCDEWAQRRDDARRRLGSGALTRFARQWRPQAATRTELVGQQKWFGADVAAHSPPVRPVGMWGSHGLRDSLPDGQSDEAEHERRTHRACRRLRLSVSPLSYKKPR